ncbi:MAG: hypothetical protein OEU26_28155, partial [Candidatus Tectomicrobia bacterium]|nr:hypothetical protein [Candidatus Tectomicrobia bacterium]
MKQAKLRSVVFFILWSFFVALALSACGGGGGSGSDPRSSDVEIIGRVDDGTTNPIGNAICYFEQRGVIFSLTATDGDGNFSMPVVPDVQGFLLCSPRDLPNLSLSSFISTEGRMAGDRIQLDENVNPESTVLAELIRQTPPSIRRNFETRLRVMVSRGEPNITLLIEVATRLYDVLRMSGINVDFATSEERDPTTYDGLIEGNVGNGLESSPIPRSICDFSLSLNGDTLVTTVLSDLFDNGRLDRPDLQPIADQLPIENPEAIPRALGELTPDGKIGRAIMTTADDETSSTPGYYQLPIPPHLSGFVRCRPPDFQELSLATFVPGRQPGDTISAQHVTPPTTVFSTHIANTLGVGENLASTKQNFTDDTIGLSVAVVRENQMITDFNLIDHQNITNKEVGLVGFAATALYNIFLQNQIEIDYMKTLDDFINARAVDPDFLVNMFGISAAQADELAGIVNGAVDRA